MEMESCNSQDGKAGPGRAVGWNSILSNMEYLLLLCRWGIKGVTVVVIDTMGILLSGSGCW